MTTREQNLFKKSFWLGRLIWIKGGKESIREEKLGNLLLECRVLPSEVFHLEADQFVDVFSRGIHREMMKRYEVVVVKGFENLTGSAAISFLRALQLFCDLQFGFSLQLVLLSPQSISSELDRFEKFKPTEISLSEDSEDPGEMNERLHDLLALAMKITGVTVNRISQRAAIFLEGFLKEEGDYDALVLLAMGLGRSNRDELRLRDLVPNPNARKVSISSAELPCF
jgi:hypothetical protein